MKTLKYFLFALSTVFIVACEKTVMNDPVIEEEPTVNPEEIVVPEPEKIDFSVAIDTGSDSNTKASLSDLNICWQGGEIIFIGNSVDDTVEDCSLTVDPSDSKKGTISITSKGVDVTYYALFTGGSASSDGKVTFDHSTQTFAGSEVAIGQTRLTSGTPHRTDLAMAGKTVDGNITMKPCLALIKFKIHANSVAGEYVDASGYSSVRGFNIMLRHSGSRTMCCGNYTVNLSGSDFAVSPAATGTFDYKQLNNGSRMSSDTDYYFSVIPVGAVEKIDLQFLCFKWDEGTSTYKGTWGSDAKDYKMSLEQSLSFDSGDFFNFGTLNPVDLQKAKDAFVPAVDIDGVFTDWTSATATGGPKNKYTLSKFKYDKYYIYFYCKTEGIEWSSSNYFYFCLDTDNNSTTGGELWSRGGFETIFYISPFSSTVGTYKDAPSINRSYPSSVDANASCAGTWDSESKTAEIEFRISRSDALVSNGNSIRIWTYAQNGSDGYFYYDDVVSITD